LNTLFDDKKCKLSWEANLKKCELKREATVLVQVQVPVEIYRSTVLRKKHYGTSINALSPAILQ
jgi:hypothetical protein